MGGRDDAASDRGLDVGSKSKPGHFLGCQCYKAAMPHHLLSTHLTPPMTVISRAALFNPVFAFVFLFFVCSGLALHLLLPVNPTRTNTPDALVFASPPGIPYLPWPARFSVNDKQFPQKRTAFNAVSSQSRAFVTKLASAARKPNSLAHTMCYQLVELYAACRCLYYKHAIDRCAGYGSHGHCIQQRTIYVGYACTAHSSRSQQHAAPHSYSDSGYHSIRSTKRSCR